jgi:hypothetical protein
MNYDIEVNSTASPEENASTVVAAWKARRAPNAFTRMTKALSAA